MAQHTIETVKGYRIHYFESAEAAQMWLKETFGDDADFVSYLSKSDIFVWASQICEHFDGQEYAQQEIVQIIKDRDTKALSKINPQYFQYVKTDLTKEDTQFLAENLSILQMERFPNRSFSLFDGNNIETMLYRVSKEKRPTYFYKLYTMKRQYAESDKTEFVQVKAFTLTDALERKFKYISRYKDRVNRLGGTNKAVDRNHEYVSINEVSKYLSLNIQYITQLETLHTDSLMYKHLGAPEYDRNRKYFRTENLIKYVSATYRPMNDEIGNIEERRFPKEGLFKLEELFKMYDCHETITARSVLFARRQKTISYFQITDKAIRYSRKDFEDFMEFRAQRDIGFIKNVVNRDLIQFPKDATDSQKDLIMKQYISEEEWTEMMNLAASNNIQNIYESSARKLLVQYAKKYRNREDGKLYFLKSDISKMFKEHYGYLGEDGKMKYPVPFNIDTMQSAHEQNDDYRGRIYTASELADYWMKQNPALTKTYIMMTLNRLTKTGKIPVIKITKVFKYYYLPHIEDNETIIHMLSK